jgi:hypothetical protein
MIENHEIRELTKFVSFSTDLSSTESVFHDGTSVARQCRRMLKIRRSEDDGLTIFALSGRIEELHVSELEELLAGEVAKTALDLAEVRLVDREVVRFLAGCEARGISLRNCPSYVREWIETGRGVSHEPQS